jgi:hypothetical protein
VIDAQALTLAEALTLLTLNVVGLAVTFLAWRVSDLDVAEAYAWDLPIGDEATRLALRHNRLLVTKDARHGEWRRLQLHVLLGAVGVFWALTPQPVNPAVVWWAVGIRSVVILTSLLLIDKTAAHLVARYRFDKPGTSDSLLGNLRPALALAWREMWHSYRRREGA